MNQKRIIGDRNMKYGKGKCKRCGKKFQIRNNNHVFCSTACRYEYDREKDARKRAEKIMKYTWVLDMSTWQWREKNGNS